VFFQSTAPNPNPVTRTCTVPVNEALFFPILDISCSALEVRGGTNNGCGADPSEAALRSLIKSYIDPATHRLRARIDGAAVGNVSSYRVVSPPGCFSYTLAPADDLLTFLGERLPGRQSGCAVADGWYLLLSPLPAGQHRIDFQAAIPSGPFAGFALDITYNLTVQ